MKLKKQQSNKLKRNEKEVISKRFCEATILGLVKTSIVPVMWLWIACFTLESSVTHAQSKPMPKCPIMPDSPASEKYFADHKGLRYYFCCEGCVSDFQSDPSRFVNVSTVQGFPIESATNVSEMPVVNDAGDQSKHAKAKNANDKETMLEGTMTYLKATMQKRIDKYCLDTPLVQIRVAAFCGIMFVPFIPFFRKRQESKPFSASDRINQMSGTAGKLITYCASKLELRWLAWIVLAAVSFDSISMASRSSRSERQLLEILAGDKSLDDRNHTSAALDEETLELIQEVHYSTFADYGYPPRPKKREKDLSLTRTYFRGNDERNPQMFNGGQYRTVTFDVNLESRDGTPLNYGSSLSNQPVFLKVRFIRAPHTSSGYYTREYMKRMYLTMQSGRFLGRDQPVGDRLEWTEIEEGRVWEARFQLPEGDHFPETWKENERRKPLDTTTASALHRGVVYLCEERLDENQNVLGGRFHFAIEYTLKEVNGELMQTSDLFMGTNYRGSNFTKYDIIEEEWLSSKPIPEKPTP
ncbi:MAG TPA: hypothetical protein DDZ51_02850 [Planctomycetaceae bacterium]|nr:hypothetical protein [Planctomycetaceae bacterium]